VVGVGILENCWREEEGKEEVSKDGEERRRERTDVDGYMADR
jgi:hypothetical protein